MCPATRMEFDPRQKFIPVHHSPSNIDVCCQWRVRNDVNPQRYSPRLRFDKLMGDPTSSRNRRQRLRQGDRRYLRHKEGRMRHKAWGRRVLILELELKREDRRRAERENRRMSKLLVGSTEMEMIEVIERTRNKMIELRTQTC